MAKLCDLIETEIKGYKMRILDICLCLFGFLLIGFIIGAKVAEPGQCMHMCVAEFERMGC